MSSLIVSIHDVSPATAVETAWWVDQVERLGKRATLLVIPGPWRGRSMSVGDPLSVSLRLWAGRGHEISLHGWDHRQSTKKPVARILARGAGEFAGLDSAGSESRLVAGLGLLSANEIAASGFTPPGWLISRDAARAVRHVGIDYLTTHLTIHDFLEKRTLNVPVVCHRPGSPLSGAGVIAMRAAYAMARRTGRDLRIAIHPDDAHDRRLAATTLRILRSAVQSGLDVVPYRDYLGAA